MISVHLNSKSGAHKKHMGEHENFDQKALGPPHLGVVPGVSGDSAAHLTHFYIIHNPAEFYLGLH